MKLKDLNFTAYVRKKRKVIHKFIKDYIIDRKTCINLSMKIYFIHKYRTSLSKSFICVITLTLRLASVLTHLNISSE